MAPVTIADPDAFHMRFNPSGSMFVVVTRGIDQHRLQIWDTVTNKVISSFADKATSFFTAVIWGFEPISNDQMSNGEEEKSRKKRKATGDILALGSKNGSIQFYSPSRGAITKKFDNGHSMPVTDVVFGQDGSSMFSSSSDGSVVQWDLATGEIAFTWRADKSSIDQLCLGSGDKVLATAGSSIKLWDLETRQQAKAFIGFSTSVSQLSLSASDKQHFISFSREDRYINVWKDTGKSFVLTAPDNVCSMDSSKRILCAVTGTGKACIWKAPLEPVSSSKKKSRKPDGIISIKSENGDVISVLAASCAHKHSLLIARGTFFNPVFETIDIADGAFSHELVRKASDSSLMAHDSSENTFDTATHQKSSDEYAIIVGTVDAPLAKATHADTMDLGDEKASLSEKLKLLRMMEPAKSQPTSGKKTIPKADSLLQMLSQALHSSDQELLEQCLQTGQEAVIQKTVSKLSPQHILPFLEVLVERFQLNPNRGPQLAKWLKAVLMSHMAYLLSHPNLAQKLAPLYQTIDARLANFPKLLQLNGRLELLSMQIKVKAENSMLQNQDDQLLAVPHFVYDENLPAMDNADEMMSDSEFESGMEDVDDMESDA